MIYFQLLLILFLLIFMIKLEIKTIASPSVITLAMFFISTFFAAIYKNKWKYTFSINAFFILSILLFIFCITELVVDKIFQFPKYSKPIKPISETPIVINNGKLISICLIMVFMNIYYYKAIHSLSVAYGNTQGGLWRTVYYARQAQVHGNYSLNKVAVLMFSFCKCIAFVFFFLILYNRIIAKYKKNIKCIIPILLWFPMNLISGQRTYSIYFIIFGFISFIILYQSKNSINMKFLFKIFKIGIISLIVFAFIFQITGKLKLSGIGESAINHVAKYVGFSIPAFSNFLNNHWKINAYFGATTLNRLYSITNKIGLTNIAVNSRFLPFTDFPGGITANVYTAFSRYINDFGIIGTIFVTIIISGFYSILKNITYYLLYTPQIYRQLIIYASFIWPLSLISIEEMFFNEFVSTTPIYILIFYFFIDKFLFTNKIQRKFKKNHNIVKILSN